MAVTTSVIVLPAFIAVCAWWWLTLRLGWDLPWLPLAALLLAAVLWYCTAMIYACIRFIQEWAQPLTVVNFTLIGLSSGLVLACALAALMDQRALLLAAGPIALVVTLGATATRWAALRHNARLHHKSTLQSATGIHAPHLKQMAMGMTDWTAKPLSRHHLDRIGRGGQHPDLQRGHQSRQRDALGHRAEPDLHPDGQLQRS
jgi:DMSO reductase anchor subunit